MILFHGIKLAPVKTTKPKAQKFNNMENIFAKIAQDTTKFDLGDDEVRNQGPPDENNCELMI